MVPRHLGLDVDDVHVCSPLGHRVQLRQLPPDPLEEADLEANQVVVDAHPVAGVLPVLGFDVLPLERAPGWPLCFS